MAKLGVNIDHVATLRQQRREFDPDPVEAARICEEAGADSIVSHLREDRRHVQDQDARQLRKIVRTRWNLEMSLSPGIMDMAVTLKPDLATMVPERRQELTTEGGLNTVKYFSSIASAIERLRKRNVEVSLFVDPTKRQIAHAKAAGAKIIELHTGRYSSAGSLKKVREELLKLTDMTQYARSLGLKVSAGHGLKYHNAGAVARIPGIEELNIGHSIICRALFTGLAQAVREMKAIIGA